MNYGKLSGLLMWVIFGCSLIFALFYLDKKQMKSISRAPRSRSKNAARREFYLVWSLPVLSLIAAFVVPSGEAAAKRVSAEVNDPVKAPAPVLAKAVKAVEIPEEAPGPRTITADQQRHFIEFLAKQPKGKFKIIAFNNIDAEASQYLRQIVAMLQAAGYTTDPITGIIPAPTPVTPGVFLLVKDSQKMPPFAGAAQEAFSEIGIKPQGLLYADLDGDELGIIVSSKP